MERRVSGSRRGWDNVSEKESKSGRVDGVRVCR